MRNGEMERRDRERVLAAERRLGTDGAILRMIEDVHDALGRYAAADKELAALHRRRLRALYLSVAVDLVTLGCLGWLIWWALRYLP